MALSDSVTVKVDKQGRLVLPQRLRDELLTVPGEVVLQQTPEGLLLRPVAQASRVRMAEDGLPVLELDRMVTNDEVLAAIDRERRQR